MDYDNATLQEAHKNFLKILYKKKLIGCIFRCGICQKNMDEPKLFPFFDHYNVMFNEDNYNLFHEDCVNPHAYFHYLLETLGEDDLVELILQRTEFKSEYTLEYLQLMIDLKWTSEFEI